MHVALCRGGGGGAHLAEDEDVGLDAVVVAGQHAAGARAPRLHLVADQQRVVLVQQLLGLPQVPSVGDDHPCLALRVTKSSSFGLSGGGCSGDLLGARHATNQTVR